MADQDLLHTAEVVKAALPFIDPKSKVMAEFFVRIFELMGSLKSLKSPNNMAACGFEDSKLDMEGLLNGIRPVCSNKEREMVDRFLNIFRIKKMFEMYNSVMETMKTMQEFGGFSFDDGGSGADTDTVTGNFGGSNFESIFNSFRNSSANTSETDSGTGHTQDSDYDKEKSESNDSSAFNNSGGKTNDMMFEMFKTMIPPEKLSTFENLSMLLNTMSYDNNSKPENKERNDG
jgi:hypothetical protein